MKRDYKMKKLSEKQKEMIRVLSLCYENSKKGDGLCYTLLKLNFDGKSSKGVNTSIKRLMRKYFTSDTPHYAYWLSEEYNTPNARYINDETSHRTKTGNQLRKDLYLNAIEFIKATGLTK